MPQAYSILSYNVIPLMLIPIQPDPNNTHAWQFSDGTNLYTILLPPSHHVKKQWLAQHLTLKVLLASLQLLSPTGTLLMFHSIQAAQPITLPYTFSVSPS